MTQTLDELKAEFEAKGLMVIDTFDHDGSRYAVYHINPNNPMNYVTGDRYNWEVGLRYDTERKQLYRDYLLEEGVKAKIEYALKG